MLGELLNITAKSESTGHTYTFSAMVTDVYYAAQPVDVSSINYGVSISQTLLQSIDLSLRVDGNITTTITKDTKPKQPKKQKKQKEIKPKKIDNPISGLEI